MNTISPRPGRELPLSLFLIVMAFAIQSCGVVGPPLPPEDIGIEAKIRSQQPDQENLSENEEQQIVPLDQEDVALPPLKPLGAQ